MANLIAYNGADKWKQKATDLLNQTGTANVDDVKVIDDDHPQGQSVVTNKVAEIDLTPYAEKTAIVQSDWNEADTTASDYIKNKPTIPAPQEQADWLEADASDVRYIKNKPTIPAAQVQSDYNQSDSSAVDYIKNKPTLGTASAKDFDTELDQLSGNLITNQAVVEGLVTKASLTDLNNYYTKSETYDRSEVDVVINIATAQKQDTLIEGNGIEINQNSVIDVTDTAYRFAEGSVDGAFEVTNPSGVSSNIPVHNVIRHGGTLEATQSNPIDFNDEAFRGANARHVYWIGINQYVSNAPVANGSYGNFECFGSMQRFSRYRQTGCGQVFQRHYMNNSWSPWMRMNQDIHTIETDDMTSAVALTSGSYGTLAQVTLSAGIWQFNARASFASNATGNRAIMVTSSNTSTSSYDGMYVRVPSAGGSHTTGLCVSGCFELTQQTTLYLRGFQNSGGNLNASSASIRAIRIA